MAALAITSRRTPLRVTLLIRVPQFASTVRGVSGMSSVAIQAELPTTDAAPLPA